MDYKYSFVFVEKARNDLDEILNYISFVLNNTFASKELFDKIIYTINNICSFPKMYPLVTNDFLKSDNTRKAVVDNYIIFYNINSNEKTIIILRIIYAKRDINSILEELGII